MSENRQKVDTVDELIHLLETFPRDARVFGCWEGQDKPIIDVIYDEKINAVCLDVDDGWLRDAMNTQNRRE